MRVGGLIECQIDSRTRIDCSVYNIIEREEEMIEMR